ncbi:hypothetical protein QFZ58_006522 [Streptomyces sp. B1I3]|nr:hypothetical protein [Streptomyces sp. B1I3]
MIRWTYAFIDRPAAVAARATAFWAEVTGTHASAPWGERGEFTTLLADGADACLATQAVGGPGGAHPDLAVEDMAAFTARAGGLGAVLETRKPELTVLRSPGGQPFCLVPWRGRQTRPPVLTGPAGVTSRLDQLCVDVAPAAFEAEVAFWTALTGWDSRPADHAEFHVLRPLQDLPVHLLIQRLDEPRPAVRASGCGVFRPRCRTGLARTVRRHVRPPRRRMDGDAGSGRRPLLPDRTRPGHGRVAGWVVPRRDGRGTAAARQGVVMAGRGSVAIPLPMAKPGCGGWLQAVFCHAGAVPPAVIFAGPAPPPHPWRRGSSCPSTGSGSRFSVIGAAPSPANKPAKFSVVPASDCWREDVSCGAAVLGETRQECEQGPAELCAVVGGLPSSSRRSWRGRGGSHGPYPRQGPRP